MSLFFPASSRRPWPACPGILILPLVLAGAPVLGGEIIIQRTIMPDANPSSFAVSFPQGVSLCFDPVRMGINYAWIGSVDLAPAWTGKNIEPAEVQGKVFYRETGRSGLRIGDPSQDSRLQFRGYVLREGYPEFHYLVNGQPVREWIRPLADGRGFERKFELVLPAGMSAWFVGEPQGSGGIAVEGARRLADNRFLLEGPGAVSFTVTVHDL